MAIKTERKPRGKAAPSLFSIRFSLRNEVFAHCPSEEIGRLLSGISESVRDGKSHGELWDANGNRVGNWGWIPATERT